MNQHIPLEDILRASRIGAAKARLQDPAINRQDAHQEICLQLLTDDSVTDTAIAVWRAIHQHRDIVKPKHSRHRIKQQEWPRDEKTDKPMVFVDEKQKTPANEVEANELHEIIKNTKLTKGESVVIDLITRDYTPKEIAETFGIRLTSVQNLIAHAVGKLRQAVGSDATGQVRLGRCKRSRGIRGEVCIINTCDNCGNKIDAKKFGVKYCSIKCKNTMNNEKQQQAKKRDRQAKN